MSEAISSVVPLPENVSTVGFECGKRKTVKLDQSNDGYTKSEIYL